MSADWVNDINRMHNKYGTREWINNASPFELKMFLKFRIDFLREEYDETREAMVLEDNEEIVDGLIDLCVIAIGTLDAMGVNAHKAWDQVLNANMAKEVGVKSSRPNPLGLPDLVKPEGWIAPDHSANHGILASCWDDAKDRAWSSDERMDIIGQNGNDGLHYPPPGPDGYTPHPGPLDGTGTREPIDWTKDSEYVRLYGKEGNKKV